ncbi:MAG: AMP-binding protein [Acidimicrobiales bacterium]
MAELIKTFVDRKRSDVALIDELGQSSWSEFNERVNRVIHLLRDLGLGPGDTVALMCGNRREFFEVAAAAIHSSLVFVPVNWHWVSRELAYVLADSDAKVLFVEDQFAEVAREACEDPQAEGCATRIIIGDTRVAGFNNYEELIATHSMEEPEGQASGGPMFYTSGTTGFPKGVRTALNTTGHDVQIIRTIAAGAGATLRIPSGGVTLLDGPAYHSAQLALSLYPVLGLGSTCVMQQHFDAETFLTLVDQHRVTNVHLVPTQFIRLLQLPDERRQRFDGSSLVSVIHGAAPCPIPVKQAMLAWWGPIVTEYYGATESGFLTIIHALEWLEHPGSLGKPLPSSELFIVDDEERHVGAGEVGQIYFKNRSGADFRYHKADEKTHEAHLTPGMGTTGDVGYVDGGGYLFMSDRKIDMIISGGVNIYPAEIENVLLMHPAVADAAVFGIPDEEMGEQVKAAVELAPGAVGSAELAAELIEYVRENLAGYKAPKSIDFEEHLPRQPTGKLYKRLLRDPYWESSGRSI